MTTNCIWLVPENHTLSKPLHQQYNVHTLIYNNNMTKDWVHTNDREALAEISLVCVTLSVFVLNGKARTSEYPGVR